MIGNDCYHHWEKLETAVADATAVAQVLRKQYGFEVTEIQMEHAKTFSVPSTSIVVLFTITIIYSFIVQVMGT
ncbi:MAG: hypothetical protein GKS05_03010 [Nitrospirales bacterium]|nr:hypothetical protein [Nitrospirales bacterium]